MVKSRFVVLQMKDIVRTGIFVIIGLILLIVLIWAIMPRGAGTDMGARNFTPGTYTSYIIIHNRPIGISVTVDESRIIDIALSEMEESQEVFYPLIRPTMATLSAEVISRQTTNIEAPADAAITSRILLDAINNALMQASMGE